MPENALLEIVDANVVRIAVMVVAAIIAMVMDCLLYTSDAADE